MKINTADCETSFYIRLKEPLFARRRLRPECPCSIPYGAAALQARLGHSHRGGVAPDQWPVSNCLRPDRMPTE